VSSQDQRFKDFFSIVIGFLIAVTLTLIVLATVVGGGAQKDALRADKAWEAQVLERLRPAGRVALPGQPDEVPAAPAAASAAPAPVTAPLSGAQVFNQACNACHGAGIGGAPKLGDKAAWSARIAQGAALLHKHAIEGFQGATGVMPAKGGNTSLSDEEVINAVDYMVSQAK